MKYFENFFENIEYEITDKEQIKNIFKKYAIDINNEILEKTVVYPGETLHSISYKIYGTIDYWWLIAMVNGLNDIFDVYYSESLFEERAKTLANEYLEENPSTTKTFDELYLEFYNKLKDEQIYEIYVVNPNYIDVVIDILKKAKF